MKFLHVYSIPGCIWCSRVKEFLKMHGVSFAESIIDDQEKQIDFCKKWGTSTFPQVFFNDGGDQNKIGGHDKTVAFIAAGKHLGG